MKKLLLIIMIACMHYISVAQVGTKEPEIKKVNNGDQALQSFFKKLKGKPWHDKYPGFTKTSGGIGISMPIIPNIKPSVWTGLEYRSKYFRVNYYTSMATYKITPERDTSSQLTSFSLTYLRPLNFLKMGHRNNKGTEGWLLQPTLGITFRNIKTPNKSKSTGMYISPEIQLQIPYSVITFKVDVGYNLSAPTSKLYNTVGLVVFPQLSFQFDALKDYHNTRKIITGEYSSTTETSYYYTVRDHTRAMRVMDGFWAINFRAEMGTKAHPLATSNLGVGLSGRWSTLMFDSYVSYGKYFARGFYDVESSKKPTDLTPFNGTVNNFGINLNAGVDALLTIMKLFNASAYKDLGYETPYFSIYMGMGLNFLVPGETKFANPTLANTTLDSYFAANPDIERSAKNDPGITKAGIGYNFFIQFETASIGFTLNGAYQKKIGGIATIGIIYLFPLKLKKE